MLHINKVQELTGVTARTLRYYDSIDLLKPAEKTEGGHRLYTSEEIKRLQQIQFLQSVGFKLKEIKQMLYSKDWNWSDRLKKQLAYILKEQENLQKMEGLLRGLINSIQIETESDWMAIQKVMQLSNADGKMKKFYRDSVFSEREMDLWAKVPDMGSDSPETLEWIALIGQLQKYMGEGAGSRRVQHIIRRMDEKRLDQFEGEDEFIDKLWEIRKSEVESEKLGLYPIDQELLEFMEEAYSIYEKRKV